MSATKTRVYVAFDFGDRKLAAMMGGQLRNPNSGYEVANWSLKEARPEASWETDAEYKIKRLDLLMIVLGRNTHRADGVLREVSFARRAGCSVLPDRTGFSSLRHAGSERRTLVPMERAEPPVAGQSGSA